MAYSELETRFTNAIQKQECLTSIIKQYEVICSVKTTKEDV